MRFVQRYLEWNYSCLGPQGFGDLARDDRRRLSLGLSIHKLHHCVLDGEMDWVVSFRFNPLEAVVYRGLQWLPLAWLGLAPEALMAHAIVATAIGHLNHSNLDLGHGAWRFVVNSPRMHLWHHDRDGAPKNFGIIFSAWDWLFGTAHLPADAPRAIGIPTPQEG